jgi:hypothetical protein
MIDYTFKHDKVVEFFNYLENFLQDDAPREQILEELQSMCSQIAYHENDLNRIKRNQEILDDIVNGPISIGR